MIPESSIFRPFPILRALVCPVYLSFSSSKSSTASSQTSSTQTAYNTTDKRVGVEGEGNIIAGEGAQVEISVTDVSADLAAAVARNAADTSRAAITANADAIGRAAALSSDALASNVEVSRRALDSGDRAVQAVSATYADLSADQVRLLSDVVKSNAETTEATRAGNASLAQSLGERLLTAAAESKQDMNEKIVTTGIQYLAYAAVGIAAAYLLTRRKAA